MAVTIKQIKQALKSSFNKPVYAAEKLGITYNALYDRVQKSKDLQRYREELDERNLDFTEIALMKGIKKGDSQLIKYHLNTKGRKRGYGEKTEVELSGEVKGNSPQYHVNFTSNPKNDGD
jgi:hypothetical protein